MERIIQISAGRGPLECCWVVGQVLKIFIAELTNNNLNYYILQKQNGSENGTVQSVTVQLTGNNIDAFLKQWIGTVQWIGKSKYRKHYKRKNWFIGIYELKEITSAKLQDKDIIYQTMRSQGKGGQHVNKVSSAVRAIHQPTGVAAVSMDSRSQHQNKKIARERLAEKFAAANLDQLTQKANEDWSKHLNIERGNPTRVFTGSDFKKQPAKATYKTKRTSLKNNLKNELRNL